MIKGIAQFLVKLTSLTILLSFFLTTEQEVAHGQTTADVTITGIPGILPSPYFSDFEQNVYSGRYQVMLNVMSPGNTSVNLRFHVIISKNGEELINETSLPTTFEPGIHAVAPFPDYVEFSATTNQVLRGLPSNIVQQVFQGGTFPEGNYTIRIEAREVGETSSTGQPGIANFMVRYPQPPVLLTPANNSRVDVNIPVFSWTPVMAPRGTTIEYEFILVELFDGQNSGDALLSNREHASGVVTGTNSLPYTGAYLPLEEGVTYAWQVIARDADDRIPLNNNGESEIYVFTYGDEPDEDEEEDDILTGIPDPGLEFVPMPIPVSTISGNVQWSFSPTEGGIGLQTMFSEHVQDFQATGNMQVGSAIDDPNYKLDTDTGIEGSLFTDGIPSLTGPETTPRNTVPVFGGGRSTGAQLESFDMVTDQIQQAFDNLTTHPLSRADVKLVYKKRDGSTKVLATGTADENGDFTLTFVPSELEAISDAGNGDGTGSSGRNNLQSLVSGEHRDSRFQEEAQAVMKSVSIVVDSPYFSFSEEKSLLVKTNAPDSYDAGTLTGTALTYRLRPDVIDRKTGNPIPDATVEILRRERWYHVAPELEPEGYPLDRELRGNVESVNNRNYVKVAETSSGGLATRLFPRKQSSMDRYTIRVNARGYETLVTHISASPELNENDVVTVNREFSLRAALPMVEGRIVRSDTQAPMADVPVQLRPLRVSGYSPDMSYFTMSDEDGRFTIAGIEPRDGDYRLKIEGDRVETYEEDLLLDERGIVVERDPIMLDPRLITVAGKVENDQGEPVPNATVRWEDGGTSVNTDNQGRFVTANTPGSHLLQVRKIGHRDVDTTLTVQLTEDTEYDFSPNTFGTDWSSQLGNSYASAVGQWAEKLQNTNTFQSAVEEEDDSPFNPAGVGYFGNTAKSLNVNDEEASDIVLSNNLNMTTTQFGNTTAYFSNLFGEYGVPGDFYDAGTILMNRAVGKLDVTVEDSDTGEPVADAVVEVGHGGLQGTTDSDGHIYFDEAPGGTVPVSISAPETTFYVPMTTEVSITDDGSVTYIDIPLETGSRVVGLVTASGEPVEGASVRVEGRDDINTTTDSDGNYILAGIPAGEWTLRTTASGLVGASETKDFTAQEELTINFNLQDAGFNIATLLGFDIEVDEISTASDTTITGAFVSIPSNPLLSVSEDLRIPFSGIQVYEEGGDLRPVGGEVQTDVSELQAELFDFLTVTVSNHDGLIVRPREIMSDIGYIAGIVEADYAATFTSATGWQWPNVDNQYLKLPDVNDLPGAISENELVALTSNGSFPFPDIGVPDFELEFGSASSTFSVYGFGVELSLNESVLKNDGFHLSGGVKLSEIPLLDEATLDLETLWIGTNGSVKEAQLELDPHPELALANWKMALFAGGISETGLNVGGALEFSIPGSDITEISFSDLLISSDQIYGGNFTFPADGIDIFGIVEMNSRPGKDIMFGKVQGEQVYYITGGATIDLPRYVDKSLVFRDFLIRTDGEFNANIAANFEADFWGLADLSVTGVRFQNTSNPAIHVDGQFGLHGIPLVSAQAGGLTYAPGGSVSFEQLDFEFDLASIGTVGAGIGLIDTAVRQGFSGSGSMDITGTSIAAGIDFYYERMDDGIAFGGEVEAGIPPIPVGSVSIENVGGGFSFDSSNDEYSVTLSGRVSAAPGTGDAVSLDPLQVTVASGPVITGYAALTVMNQDIADANLTIDYPNRYFDLLAQIEFNSLERVNISANADTRLVVSGEQGNRYWMVGARMDASLLDLFDSKVDILAAANLDVNKNPQLSSRTNFVVQDDDNFFNTSGSVLSGVFLEVGIEIGRPPSNPKTFDLSISGISLAKLYGYMYSATDCKLKLDFANNNYGFLMGSIWQAGGGLDIFKWSVASIHGEASGSVGGGYENGHWWASGGASGRMWGSLGKSCDSGCRTGLCTKFKVPVGAQGCVRAGVDVDYHSSTGLDISFSRN